MIDLTSETPIPLAQAAKLVPPGRSGKKTHLSTLFRWITQGCKAPNGEVVRLEAIRLGSRWMTSREALQRFAEALTPDIGGTSTDPAPTPTRRAREARRVEAALEEAGI
jgi:hypothetical protein